MAHQPGDVIRDRFRIDDTLGQGGFAVTWRGTDLTTGQSVAIKELSIRAVQQWRAIELFEREARVLRNLDHPNIPAYVDFITPDASTGQDTFVLVQALAPGRSLADRIRDGWRATEDEARAIARTLLQVLSYLHGLSPPAIHRDIKPQNIILDDAGQAMLVDFGAVRDTLATESEVGSVAGTFGYMAPEQFAGRVSPASDLYGLGATLVHLLSHRAPAELPMQGLRLDFRPFVSVSDPFAAFLDRLLAPSPEERFPSAKAGLDALDGRLSLVSKPKVAPPPRRTDDDDDRPAWTEPALPYARRRASVLREGETLVATARNVALDGGVTGIAKLVFASFWLGFVYFWTTTAVENDAPTMFAMFSIPFWIVGFGLVISGIRSLPTRTRLRFGPDGLHYSKHFLGIPLGRRHLPLREITGINAENRGIVDVHVGAKHDRVMNMPFGDEAESVAWLLENHRLQLQG